MPKPKLGEGVIVGRHVVFGKDTTIWNYVVIGDGTQIGEGTIVGSFCDIGKDVSIGKNCNIQAHVTISNECRIGDFVFIAPNTSLLNDKYPISHVLTPVIVKDKAIIGGGVTILPGVTVEEGAVIGGGSVVTRDVPPKTVVIGIPAKSTMTAERYESKRKAFLKNISK